MKAYFGSRISPNITRTEEGYLVCHNVPIARTGWYEYLPQEIGADGDKVVQVYRPEEEVFDPKAMASFEGKPFTNNHPPEGVDPSNFSQYAKGHVTNVRRGKGDDDDLLLGDIVANDEQTLNDIVNGKRELSAGYECDYEPNDDGTFTQRNIRGNHVALVDAGRAGDRIRINDSKTNGVNQSQKNSDTNSQSDNPKARDSSMANSKLPIRKPSRMTNFLAAVGLKTFAMDADPGDVMEAMDAYAEEKGTETDNDFPVPTTQESKGQAGASEDDAPDVQGIDELKKQVAALTELVQKTLAPKAENEDPEKRIDDAIAQMQNPEGDDEESGTIEANDEEGPVTAPEDRPKSGFQAADSAAAVAYLKAMKPAIAKIKDPAEKKMMVDAALKAVQVRPAKPSATYQKLQKPAKVQDSTKQNVDMSELGKQWMKRSNPHYKERV